MALNEKLMSPAVDWDAEVDVPAAPAPVAAAPAARTAKVDVVGQLVSDADIEAYQAAAVAGTDTGAITFLHSLGDPSVLDNFELTDPVTKEKVKREASKIIGYRFRANKEISVPDFGTTPEFSGNRVMNAADTTKWKTVAAGEEFDLTRVEVARLLSEPTFNMVADGEGGPAVRLQLAFKKVNPEKPVTSVADLPDAQLVLAEGNGSIKNLPIVDVITYEKADKSENRFAKGTRVVVPEFAGTKFENVAKDATVRRARRGAGQAAGPKDNSLVRVRQAAAFQKMFQGLQG